MFCCISSSALRWASLIAATMRSCSISTSSFETTSGSIFSDCTCLAPLTTTVTMPPPASPSTRSSAICFCRRSCICCACFIISWMFIAHPSHLFYIPYLCGKHVEHRLHARVGERLVSKRALLVRRFRVGGGFGSGRFGLNAGDRDLAARDLLRDRLQPRAILLEHVQQRLLVRREREGHAIAGHFDPLRLRADGAVEHHLRLADLGEQGILEARGWRCLGSSVDRLRTSGTHPARRRRSRRCRRY